MGLKFVKHRANASEGTLAKLIEELGVEAYGRYWLLIEACAKKLEKPDDREFEKSDFVFTFTQRQIRDVLRTKSKHCEIFLRTSSDLSLFDVDETENEVRIIFPKLLEELDRDYKRARTPRETTAQTPRLDQYQEQDLDEDLDSDHEKGIKSFLLSLSEANTHLTPMLIKTVVEKIHDALYPRKSRAARHEGVELLCGQIDSIRGLWRLYGATRKYGRYVRNYGVTRIYSFKTFAGGEWEKYIPRKYQEGA